MKVLIVDDDPVSVKGIADYCEEQNWDNTIVDFEKCFKVIMTSDPDVIVLDWCSDPGDESGMKILESIWTNGYRPVVIFSGNVEIIELPEEYKNSGLIKVIKKGNEAPVKTFLEGLKESYSAISSFRKELGKSLIEAFRVLEPVQKASGNYLGDDVIKYLLAKRAVNYFDLEKMNVPLPAWAIYQYPPVIDTFLSVCDILRKVNVETELTEVGISSEYIVVLTPSCDMVISEGRSAKVENVLFAECTEISRSKIGQISKEARKQEALKSGKENEIALPALKSVLPDMVVDMKRLGTVNISKIAVNSNLFVAEKEKYKYVRICSIDSPFREQIIGAFLNNAGRIGVPDRDFATWAKVFGVE